MTQTSAAEQQAPEVRGSKRQQVVSAAAKLFLGAGYGTTGMDAIAKEAGVSKATVYSYYKDKATLFEDVMLQLCDAMGGHDLARMAEESPEATLKTVALFAVQHLLDALDLGLLQRVVAEAKEFPEIGQKFWTQGPGQLEKFVAGYLADAHRRRRLEVKDPVRAAERFVGLVTGAYLLPILVSVRSRPSERDLRRDLDELVVGFLATLAPASRGARGPQRPSRDK
jgi:AcrR family transcriptional regulator